MKYRLLVCWDRDRMDAQPEPEPDAAPEEDEGFPWLDDLQERGIWQIGDQLAPPRRARTVRGRPASNRRGGRVRFGLVYEPEVTQSRGARGNARPSPAGF